MKRWLLCRFVFGRSSTVKPAGMNDLFKQFINSQISNWFQNVSRNSPSNFISDLLRSNRKWNIKIAVNRKPQPKIVFPVGIEDFKAWRMTWTSQFGLILCYFLTIYTLGCREPAWNLGVNFFETWLLRIIQRLIVVKIIIAVATAIFSEET